MTSTAEESSEQRTTSFSELAINETRCSLAQRLQYDDFSQVSLTIGAHGRCTFRVHST